MRKPCLPKSRIIRTILANIGNASGRCQPNTQAMLPNQMENKVHFSPHDLETVIYRKFDNILFFEYIKSLHIIQAQDED